MTGGIRPIAILAAVGFHDRLAVGGGKPAGPMHCFFRRHIRKLGKICRLARLNPGGERVTSVPAPPAPRSWITTIETALGEKGFGPRRCSTAARAAALTHDAGWSGNWLSFSLFTLGPLSLQADPTLALESFHKAHLIYAAQPETRLHATHVSVQLAAFALSANRSAAALELANAHLTALAKAKNAALLATLMLIKAEALELMSQANRARQLRIARLGWARYGFSSDHAVRRRPEEIAVHGIQLVSR